MNNSRPINNYYNSAAKNDGLIPAPLNNDKLSIPQSLLDSIKVEQRKLVDSNIIEGLFKNITLRPNNIFIGNWQLDIEKSRSRAQLLNEVHLKENHLKTNFSKKSRQNLCQSMHWLEAGASWTKLFNPDENKFYYFKTNLITLTVPSTFGDILTRQEAEKLREYDSAGTIIKISDFELEAMKEIIVSREIFQKCLNHWLTIMRRKFKLHNYVWKVELQRNGQLHIHINTDTFIHHIDIKNNWNHVLELNGLLENFKKLNKGNYPNSTDVHSIKNSFQSVGYIGKYMMKDPNLGCLYKGKVWGCSKALMPKHKVTLKAKQSDFKDIAKDLIKNNFEFKAIEVKHPIDESVRRLGTIFYLNNKDWMKITNKLIKDAYLKHVDFVKQGKELMPNEYYQTNLFNQDLRDNFDKPIDEKSDPPAIRVFHPNKFQLNFNF